MKLKLNTSSKAGSPTASSPPPPSATPSTGKGFKLKIRTSAPPTPATESAPQIPQVAPLAPPPTKPPKRPYVRKPKDGESSDKKRSAADDISPAPKRSAPSEPKRKISFKLTGLNTLAGTASGPDTAIDTDATPTSAGPKIKLGHSGRRQSTGPKAITLTAKKRPPPRPVGVGYDSEASDAETDPAVEQQFVFRMPNPSAFVGEMRAQIEGDAAYLRTAIEEKRMGLSLADGGADVSFRFVSRDLRRALVTIKGHRYAAVLVDLPCVVESMKSWDRKGGWWKVADVAQMLLVLGPVTGLGEASVDEQVKNFQLPKDVDRESRYAHGLTPPMHWVRKRRFRKRVNYRDIEDVEEEVERLLREDKECELRGGETRFRVYDGEPGAMGADDMELDAEGEYVETTEDGYGARMARTPQEIEEDELDEDDLMAQLQNMGDEEEEDADADGIDEDVSALGTEALINASDVLAGTTRSSSAAGQESSNAPTPAGLESDIGGRRGAEETSSDEDDDDDAGSADAIDEDEVAAANERSAQLDEIADLEREVANKKAEYERTTNQLLKQRVRAGLVALEDELVMRKKAMNIDDDDSEEDE